MITPIELLDANEWQEGQCGLFWQVRAVMRVMTVI